MHTETAFKLFSIRFDVVFVDLIVELLTHLDDAAYHIIVSLNGEMHTKMVSKLYYFI